jgi:hypothetical protein
MKVVHDLRTEQKPCYPPSYACQNKSKISALASYPPIFACTIIITKYFK